MSLYSSDRSLVEGLHAGRRDALDLLYREQHAAVYNLCARILGDREEAKDVTQEVFLKAFAKPPAADAKLKLRPWLYRVAANACFNHLRSRRRLVADGRDAIDALPDGVDGYHRAETVALVEATLAGLNDRYRTALVLKDLHGLPPAEIAEVLEVSRPAADVLVHRARAAFKTAFAKLGGSAPAPASLGLVLAPLAVPPSLVAAPPLPHLPAPAPPAHGLPQPDISAALPGGAGLLAKIGAATGAKVAAGVAAAAVVIGGGVVAVRHVDGGRTAAVAHPASTSPGGPASLNEAADHDFPEPHTALTGHHPTVDHSTDDADHTGDHSGDEHAATDDADASHDSSTSHGGSTGGGGSTSHSTTTATGTHDSGGGDGGGHEGGGDAGGHEGGD
jgi:RNA polymerase sigma-70 factor (ECF subfamily)